MRLTLLAVHFSWLTSALLLGLLGSCRPTGGSETNWFGGCATDSDCGGSSCLCGVCSARCEDDDQCRTKGALPGSRCSSGTSRSYETQCGGTAPPDQGLCLPGCESDLDCDEGKLCSDNVCVPKSFYNEPLVAAPSPPAPISGGTLSIIADGLAAAVADPDHDRVFIADLETVKLTATIELDPGDEPGRIVEDASGLIHVVLRRGGAVATIDPKLGELISKRPVCQYPRGIDYDVETDLLHVACVDGELVSLPAAEGEPTRLVHLDKDLRDVVVYGDRLLVSRFRSAQLLVIDAAGNLTKRLDPHVFQDLGGGLNSFKPAVAWRMIPAPQGGVLMVHQQENIGEFVPPLEEPEQGQAATALAPKRQRSSDAGPDSGTAAWAPITNELLCRGRLRAAITWFDPDATPFTVAVLPTVLPVDMALRPDTGDVMVASAAARPASLRALEATTGRTLSMRHAMPALAGADEAAALSSFPSPDAFCNGGRAGLLQPDGQVVGVAYDAKGRVVAQTREPSTLQIGMEVLELPGSSLRDTGHELFHFATVGGLACASCHPEGRDDGHTWNLSGMRSGRTQSLVGGVAGTEPLHWSGEHSTFHALAMTVMADSMRGPTLRSEQAVALARFVNAIPAWKPPVISNLSAVESGRVLFESAQVGCAACHSGPRLTNNESMLVGTGGPFQVPSLVGLSRRAPFMHDGCASTLRDRFTACGGGGDAHGMVSQLASSELADLVAYLESL